MELDDDDVRIVTFAATALHTSELAVFRAAHIAWFDRPVTDAQLMQSFHDYRVYGIAPFWVRHFARQTQGSIPFANTLSGKSQSGIQATLTLAFELVQAYFWTRNYKHARKRILNPNARFY